MVEWLHQTDNTSLWGEIQMEKQHQFVFQCSICPGDVGLLSDHCRLSGQVSLWGLLMGTWGGGWYGMKGQGTH